MLQKGTVMTLTNMIKSPKQISVSLTYFDPMSRYIYRLTITHSRNWRTIQSERMIFFVIFGKCYGWWQLQGGVLTNQIYILQKATRPIVFRVISILNRSILRFITSYLDHFVSSQYHPKWWKGLLKLHKTLRIIWFEVSNEIQLQSYVRFLYKARYKEHGDSIRRNWEKANSENLN
jgi:hypothetical protein